MQQFPSIPRAENAPAGLFDSGHLWLQEEIDGAPLRFRLRESGMVQFGDRNRTYDPDEIPLPYHHAVRHVRERFDREALRAAREDVSSVVFFGVATDHRAIDYDWDRLPSFLGFDVWQADEDDGRFLPPDAVEQVYDRLGLDTVNTFDREVRATDFDPLSYEIPDSAWYDGPAAGVVVRNKTGQRATIRHSDFEADDDVSASTDATAADLAREHATRDRVESVVDDLEARGRAVTVDAVSERVVEAIVRENRVLRDDDADVRAFRSAVASRVQQFLNE